MAGSACFGYITAARELRLSESRSVQLLKADPGLGDPLDPERFSAAREKVVAMTAVLYMAPKPLAGPAQDPHPDTTLLVIAGRLLRQLVIDRRRRSELLGPGDIVRPWDGEASRGLPGEPLVVWRVVNPTLVAFLDERLIESASPWPEVMRVLIVRAVRRAQSLAVLLTASSGPRVEDRLELVFSHLADRWGRVTPEGVRLDIPLTHELLAELVGAQRPTVTSALVRLSEEGSVVRDGDGAWLLRGGGPKAAEESQPPVGGYVTGEEPASAASLPTLLSGTNVASSVDQRVRGARRRIR